MSGTAVVVVSRARRYKVVLNAISESLPDATRFERARHVRACTEFYRATCVLIRPKAIYFSTQAGVSIAAQLEKRMTTVYREAKAATVCVPFDKSVYLCEYREQLISAERIVSIQNAVDYLKRCEQPVLLVPAGTSSDLFIKGARRLPSDLIRLSGLINGYRLRSISRAMWLSGMPVPQDIPLVLFPLIASLLAYQIYPVLVPEPAPPSPPPLVVSELPPRTHYASTASYGLQFLNNTAARLQGVARQLAIQTIDLQGSSVRVRRDDGASGSNADWSVPVHYPNRDAMPLTVEASDELKHAMSVLPGVRVADWRLEHHAHAQMEEARVHLARSVGWSLDVLAGLLADKPAELKTAKIVFDTFGRINSAELVLRLRSRVL